MRAEWIQRPVPALADTLPWLHAEAVTEQARLAVADEWGEEPERIHIEWGPVRGDWQPPVGARVSLLGTGSGGHWVAVVTAPGNPDEGTQVRLRAGVEVRQPVAARAIPRGHTLTEADIRYETGIHWGPSREVDFRVAAGWVTEAPVREGQILRRPTVRPARVVEAGRTVDIVWARDGISIRLKGRALGSAAAGEMVRVRTETGRRMEGVAQQDGLVVVYAGGTRTRGQGGGR
ncbi:MAG: flagella basal body P-ring formation protein FlgA [Gemmatimonadetes bacterium]|nr:MAG: flagella basal body P-ring formation protein FlgA [Gemmatimonadota bacterium]